ncbi:MAG: hypothetical protein J6Y01_09515 [Spirochaetales bacterium]|jgi:hypothetical protein|nr:hypothetical protein [Spirochaetales bacterium]
MEYYQYFIIFPDGEQQEIHHSLMMGDIVDINGNICGSSDLDPHRIAYRVAGCRRNDYFKEITWYYKLELMTRDDVEDEIHFLGAKQFKEEHLDKIFKKLEKRLEKKRKK